MKAFLFFVIATAFSMVHVECMTASEQKQMLMGVAQECKASEDASDDDLGKLVEKKAPDTKEGKCMFACIMEQMDLIQDGKVSKDGFMEFASVITAGDAAKMKTAEELINECSLITDDDRCELAYKVGGCLKIGGMKKKVDFGI